MRRPVIASLALMLALVACGSDDEGATTAPTEAESATVPDTSVPEMSLLPTTTVSVPEVPLPESIPTELVITEITPGSGPAAAIGDLVYVNYVGVRSEDGTQFDTNFGADPFAVTLGAGGVIAGWDQGLVGATQGERLQLDIPNDLAYGDEARGDVIQAGDALSFVIDVRAVVSPTDITAPTPDDLPLSSELAGATEAVDLRPGDGAALEAGQTGIFQLVAVRADDGTELQTTWTGDPVPLAMVDGLATEEIIAGLPGMRVGGRRLVRVPSGDEDGLTPKTDIFIVADLFAVY